MVTQDREAVRGASVINLSSAATMVVDDSPFALQITSGVLQGFGVRTRHTVADGQAAMDMLQTTPVDLLVVDCEMPGVSGYDLVRWLRRSKLEPNAFTPVIMTAAHIRRSRVAEARDCGANFLITKPFSASSLLQRIVWTAKDGRAFIEVGDYFGPDRRFRDDPPPATGERRADMIRRAQLEAERAQAEGSLS